MNLNTTFLNLSIGDKRPKIFFFPHSGSGPGSYISWSKFLNEFEVIGVQYPGRGSRIAEDFCDTLDELVTSIFHSMNWEELSSDFFFFGHSLGGLIAYELAVKIENSGFKAPNSIILSAIPSPISNSYNDRVRVVDEDELINMIGDFSNELKEEFIKNDDLLALYLEIINADIALLGTYTSSLNTIINTDIHVFGGIDDSIAITSLESWKEHTKQNFSLELFSGGHFYYQNNFSEVINKLIKIILK